MSAKGKRAQNWKCLLVHKVLSKNMGNLIWQMKYKFVLSFSFFPKSFQYDISNMLFSSFSVHVFFAIHCFSFQYFAHGFLFFHSNDAKTRAFLWSCFHFHFLFLFLVYVSFSSFETSYFTNRTNLNSILFRYDVNDVIFVVCTLMLNIMKAHCARSF